jgi:hypothetical protein
MMRWTTMDPSGFPDGANNYGYVTAPVLYIDPDGFAMMPAMTGYVRYLYNGLFNFGDAHESFGDYDSVANLQVTDFDGFLTKFNSMNSGGIYLTKPYDFDATVNAVGRVSFVLNGVVSINDDGVKVFNGNLTIAPDEYHTRWLAKKYWKGRTWKGQVGTILAGLGANHLVITRKAFPLKYMFIFDGSRDVFYE